MISLTGRQRDIVERAIDVIGDEGLSALTMRRLSDALGVTEPALYRHFENKSAILDAILSVLEAETYDRLPLETDATPHAVAAHFERLFELFADRPALATAVFLDEFASNDPQIAVRVRELLARNRERLARAFAAIGRRRHGQSAERSRRRSADLAEARATLLLGGVRLLVREWRLDGCSWNLPGRGRLLVRALLCNEEAL